MRTMIDLLTISYSYFLQPPPPSSRPPVLYYKVYHNITDFVNISSDTNITLSGAMAGETYSITVIAVNVLGDGYSNTTSGQ